MTIRFIQSWNGYQPDQIVSGLTNEATIIAAGIARSDIDGDNDGESGLAKWSTDASGNTVLVGPAGGSVLSSLVVAHATGDAATDTATLKTAILTAGPYDEIILPSNQIYVVHDCIALGATQILRGNYSTIKLADQIASALTATATIPNTTQPVVVFDVTSSAGFFVGQSVAVDDQTVAGSISYTNCYGRVTGINGNSISVLFDTSAGSNKKITTNTTTHVETATTSWTVPIGATLCTISRILKATGLIGRNTISDLRLDGNSTNNPLANRWELSPALDVRAPNSSVKEIQIDNATSDAFYIGGTGMTVESVWMTKANAMGLHIGASSASTGGEKSIISKIFVDSPGMGTGSIGHFGGLSADHPAYPGIGFSRQCDGVVIYGFEVYNTYSAPLCQGIGSIANSDCFDIEICSGVIADMVYGGFQIHGSTGDAPYDIMLHDIKVRNCAPVDLTQSWGAGAGSDAWFHSYLGSFAGTALGSRITLRNMDFIDSPLGVQSVTATLSDCNFVASVINKSSSLYIMTAGTRVNLSNVESVRPKTTGTRPASYQFSCNIYVNAATVHGNDVRIIGGYNGMRVQSGADVQISNFYGEDCYEYCAAVFSASTKLHLTSPKIRSTITLSSPYAAIENNNAGGAGGLTTVISPDIELTTNNAAQYGIRLSPNSVAGTATKVQGGVIKLIGTSTTPILSGGGTALNVVAGTLLSHTFTPGAAEISTGTVVSANI